MFEWFKGFFAKPAPKKRKPRRKMLTIATYQHGDKYTIHKKPDGWHCGDRNSHVFRTRADAIIAAKAAGATIMRELDQDAP
ncbi:MAG: hypothetical protein NUV72_07185 [Bauldia sp.]|nr:hypothetical protein [Bauldia sp.]